MYPFVTEHNDYETNMSDHHWREFGAALRRIHIALAYFRYERIIQDIAAFCKQLLFTDEGGQDREQSLQYVESNFWPNSTIDIAYQSDMS